MACACGEVTGGGATRSGEDPPCRAKTPTRSASSALCTTHASLALLLYRSHIHTHNARTLFTILRKEERLPGIWRLLVQDHSICFRASDYGLEPPPSLSTNTSADTMTRRLVRLPRENNFPIAIDHLLGTDRLPAWCSRLHRVLPRVLPR